MLSILQFIVDTAAALLGGLLLLRFWMQATRGWSDDPNRTRELAGEWAERAVAIEDALAYMEPPYWYYPVRQSLGSVYLRQGKLDAAEQFFRSAIDQSPSHYDTAWDNLRRVEQISGRKVKLIEGTRPPLRSQLTDCMRAKNGAGMGSVIAIIYNF